MVKIYDSFPAVKQGMYIKHLTCKAFQSCPRFPLAVSPAASRESRASLLQVSRKSADQEQNKRFSFLVSQTNADQEHFSGKTAPGVEGPLENGRTFPENGIQQGWSLAGKRSIHEIGLFGGWRGQNDRSSTKSAVLVDGFGVLAGTRKD